MIDRIRVSTLTLSLLLFGAAVATATTEPAPSAISDDQARAETTFLSEQLQLTATQEKQVGDINLDHARATRKLFMTPTPATHRAHQLRELEMTREQQFKKVLSGDQYRDYLAARSSLSQRGDENAPPAPAKPARP